MTKLTINDVALTVGSGITPLRSNASFWENPKFPWLKTEQLGEFQIFDTTEYISQTALDQTSIKLWPQNTISIAMYGEGKTRGNTSIIMREMATNQACCNVIVNPKVADYRFLYYWIKSNYEQLRMLSSGVRKNLNSEDIKGFPFPDTKLDIQKNVADVLYAIDLKILNNTRIIGEIEAMAKTVYDYWFVQFDFPDAGGKPYCSSGGEMALNEQLNREIPVGWKVESIISTFDVCYGYPFDTKQFVDEPNHQPVVRIRDILDSDTSAYTTESVDNKYWLCSKDLIIGMDGNFHMNFWHSTPALLNQRCVRIRGNGKHSALQAYFSAAPYIKAREQNVNRTTVGHLSADDIKALHVLTPPKELQNKATEMFESFLEKICAAKKENIELAKFRNWLLPMLMNGQVRVE